MASNDSATSELSPSYSHIGLGRHHHQASSESSLLTTPPLPKSEIQIPFTTPADTVLNHFRIVRQQDQALQSQRHTALQRLHRLHANPAARRAVVSGRADAQSAHRKGNTLPPNLLKDAMLLADRARSQHAHPLAGHVPAAHSRGLSRPATTAATGRTGRLTPQQWAPAPCSMACTSFRQSLPPHASVQSSGHGVTATRKVYTPTDDCRAQTSLSRRTAYGQVLRRVRSARGSPLPAKVQQHGVAEGLGPWSD